MARFSSHDTDAQGYTHSLLVNNENILSKWGVEFSDGHSFFIHGQKTNATHNVVRVERTKNKNKIILMVQLSTSPIKVEISETFSPTRITRACTFTPLQNVKLTDISISQAFHQTCFESIEMNDNEIPFLGIERNHQFEVVQARLRGKKFDIVIDFKSSFGKTGFVPVIYGRTSPRFGWVVHSRLFPHKIVQKAIVWCHAWWNKRIPFSDTLSKIQPLVDYLWYVGEKPHLSTRRTFGFSSFGLVAIPQNTLIRMNQTLTLKPASKKKTKPRDSSL